MKLEKMLSHLTLNWSPHARQRAAERAVRPAGVCLALAFGEIHQQAEGREVFHFGRRAAERSGLPYDQVAAHIGLAVVIASDGCVVTVLRAERLRGFRSRRPYRGR